MKKAFIYLSVAAIYTATLTEKYDVNSEKVTLSIDRMLQTFRQYGVLENDKTT